jgi:Subtilase family
MAKDNATAARRIPLIQVSYILDEFGSQVETQPPGWGSKSKGDDPHPIEFIYRRGHLLIRDQDVRRLPEADVLAEVVRHPVPGLALVKVIQKKRDKEPENLLFTLSRVEARLGAGVAAPDYLLSICPPPNPGTRCPATEPDGVPRDSPPRPGVSTDCCDGRGVLIAVADTGLLKSAPKLHPWLHGVTGNFEPEVDPAKPHYIPRYTAHGTFIASIVRAMAPRAQVRVARTFDRAGACFESEVVEALYQVMDWAPDIISLSAGTHTWLDRGLLSFRFFVDGPLRKRKGTVLVAAAGNDGLDWKFSPAKMKGVISVGALAANGSNRAWFTNYGNWVKVYAPGVNLVQAYSRGTYHYYETPGRPNQKFRGMAKWSGTSFSTPVVAGLIAARMSGTGETARQAARSLLALARAQELPGVGPVLRPGQACLSLDCQACPSPSHQSRCRCCC